MLIYDRTKAKNIQMHFPSMLLLPKPTLKRKKRATEENPSINRIQTKFLVEKGPLSSTCFSIMVYYGLIQFLLGLIRSRTQGNIFGKSVVNDFVSSPSYLLKHFLLISWSITRNVVHFDLSY